MVDVMVDQSLVGLAPQAHNPAANQAVQRRQLLAEIMPSILHELIQPVTATLLQQSLCERALVSEPLVAAAALRNAGGEVRRAAALLETIQILSAADRAPVEATSLNELVSRATALLRQELTDHGCMIDEVLAPLPAVSLSATTGTEAVLRAIIFIARATPGSRSRATIETRASGDGRYGEMVIRPTDGDGFTNRHTMLACSVYANVAATLEREGGSIRYLGSDLVIQFPVAAPGASAGLVNG